MNECGRTGYRGEKIDDWDEIFLLEEDFKGKCE